MTRDCSLNSPKNTKSEHVVYKYCFECQNKNKKLIFVHNIFWNDARMRASEKDLPVKKSISGVVELSWQRAIFLIFNSLGIYFFSYQQKMGT